MVSPQEQRTATERLDQLTFSRWVVVLLVLFAHGGGGVVHDRLNFFPLSAVFGFAPAGVGYLYVLSGFVMSLVYHRPGTKFDVRGYWMTRFVRIYPLYFISLALISLYYYDFMPNISAVKIWANLLLVQAWFPSFAQSFNYPSWSLTVEIFFYALFPFITVWAYRQPLRRLIWVTLAFWVVSQVVHFVLWTLYFPVAENILVYNPLFYLNAFLLGAVAGAWYVREAPRQKLTSRVILVVLGLGTVCVVAVMLMGTLVPGFPRGLQPMAGMFAPFFTVVILALACDRSKISATLSRKVPVFLGETSYALYILQVPVIWFYERGLRAAGVPSPEAVWGATVLPVMLVIAAVAHAYIDTPLRRWLARQMRSIRVRLLLFDLVAVALTVFLAFRIRFGGGKALAEFDRTAQLMFWLMVVVRVVTASTFRTNGDAIRHASLSGVVRRTALAVTSGSMLTGVLLWGALAAGWIPGVPRGALLWDWLLFLALSLASRLLFRHRLATPPRQQAPAEPVAPSNS